jgi:hypothetical protein
MSSPPLQPVYPVGSVGSQIELYSGPIAVDAEKPLPGRIFVDLAGDLQVRWNVTNPAWQFERGNVSLHIDLPDIGPTIVPAGLNDLRGAGQIMYANVGSTDAMCDRCSSP